MFLGPVDEQERGRYLTQYAEDLCQQGRRPLFCALSSLGYIYTAFELQEQAEQLGINLEHVTIVGAMAGTASGFAYRTALLDAPLHVHVISVEYPCPHHLRQLLEQLWEEIAHLLNVVPPHTLDEVAPLHDDYLGKDYSVPTCGSIQTIYDLARSEAILLENVYTSKTFWGTAELNRRGVIPAEAATCVFHTGGLPSLLDQAAMFMPQADRACDD